MKRGAGIALLLFAAFVPGWSSAALTEIVPPVAIISVQGKGEYQNKGETRWKDAIVRQPVGQGSFVRTGDASRMAILLADQTQIRLASNSRAQFVQVGDNKDLDTVIRQHAGRSWTQSKNVPGNLRMETPTAVAAIRGTDWEMVVEEDGRSTLTVLSGEIGFSNDLGAITVKSGEQAIAEKDKAPVKRLIVNPADRVQWVGSWTVDPARYPEIMAPAFANDDEALKTLKSVAAEVVAGRYDAAMRGIAAVVDGGRGTNATAYLLNVDFLLYQGEPERAVERLKQGIARFPQDDRFDAMLVRADLYSGRTGDARAVLDSATVRHPQSYELLLARGELARIEGNAGVATASYLSATAREPNDARGWHGLGVVESEKDDLRKARENLLKAIGLADDGPGYHAALGLVESLADKLPDARAELKRALDAHPDDYVALTGLGLLELKSGDTDAAIRAFLGASVIEPRYVPAHVYTAVAYYQAGRIENGLFELERAAKLDDKDPMPHLLASLIQADLIRPADAIVQAREALIRMPYLKSLNQIANDQKGSANLGTALQLFGLADWAQSYAQESYYPFWAGSHLFLSQQYPGLYDRNSELLQGFLTDPTVFGASNRFQTMLPKPGANVSLAMHAFTSHDGTTVEPDVTVNGYGNDSVPIAYYLEAIRTQVDPRSQAFAAVAPSYTAAFGIRPTHELGLFAYINYFRADLQLGKATELGSYDSIAGSNIRGDFGAHYEFSPQSQMWIKFGVGRENSTDQQTVTYSATPPTVTTGSNFVTRPDGSDAQIRHTFTTFDQHRVTWGYAWGKAPNAEDLLIDTAGYFRIAGAGVPFTTLHEDVKDRSNEFYIGDVYTPNKRLSIDATLSWSQYRKNRDTSIVRNYVNDIVMQNFPESWGGTEIQPRAGFVYRFQPDQLLRAAYQRWTRPATYNTISPIATAGIPLDDQIVFAGGRLTRTRAQLEWAWTPKTFTSAFIDYEQVNNLNSPFDGVQNTRSDLEELDRLRNLTLTYLPSPNQLEATPRFSQGHIASAGANINQIVSRELSVSAGYVYSDGRNTNPLFQNNAIPYIPKQRVNLSTTWTNNNRFYISAQAIYRTQRYADETNLTPLPPSWDALLRAYWESSDKKRVVEGYAENLLKKGTANLYGLNLTLRY